MIKNVIFQHGYVGMKRECLSKISLVSHSFLFVHCSIIHSGTGKNATTVNAIKKYCSIIVKYYFAMHNAPNRVI